MAAHTPEELVEQFAYHEMAQRECLKRGDSIAGNRHARARSAVFEELVTRYGDEGRDALAALLRHSEPGVRAMAAAYLLRYKHREAMEVLREVAASGPSFSAFCAQQAMKRWEEGEWQLDPDPKRL